MEAAVRKHDRHYSWAERRAFEEQTVPVKHSLYGVLILLAAPLAAQEQQHQHPPAGAPDPYAGYYLPGTKTSCCGGRDCRPVESRYNSESGKTEISRQRPAVRAAAGAEARLERRRPSAWDWRGRRVMSENVASYYWRGHGPLSKVYWLYGVLGSNVLALILLVLMQRGTIDSAWFQIVLLLLAAYTVWIVVSVWRCASNVEKPLYGQMARALTVAWAINTLMVLGFLELEFLQAIS
jgi:hypothetical protein